MGRVAREGACSAPLRRFRGARRLQRDSSCFVRLVRELVLGAATAARSRGDPVIQVVRLFVLDAARLRETLHAVRPQVRCIVGVVLEIRRHSEIVVVNVEAVALDLSRVQLGVRHQLRFRIRLAVDRELTENVHRMSAGAIALVRRVVDFLFVMRGGHGAAEGGPQLVARQAQPPAPEGR